jgi:hypothetical protein
MNAEEKNDSPSNRDKIDILMKEYDTLRAEILHRSNTRFAFVGLFGALATYALFKTDTHTVLTPALIIIAAIFLFFLWIHIGYLIFRCSRRIAEIENQINSLADEQLLVWENRQKNNIFHRFYKNIREMKEDRAN